MTETFVSPGPLVPAFFRLKPLDQDVLKEVVGLRCLPIALGAALDDQARGKRIGWRGAPFDTHTIP